MNLLPEDFDSLPKDYRREFLRNKLQLLQQYLYRFPPIDPVSEGRYQTVQQKHQVLSDLFTDIDAIDTELDPGDPGFY